MRPAAAGQLDRREIFIVGMTISSLGIGWLLSWHPLYGLVVFAGWFFDVIVYTVWLKRRTCWRYYGAAYQVQCPSSRDIITLSGEMELVGILLGLAILFGFLPTH